MSILSVPPTPPTQFLFQQGLRSNPWTSSQIVFHLGRLFAFAMPAYVPGGLGYLDEFQLGNSNSQSLLGRLLVGLNLPALPPSKHSLFSLAKLKVRTACIRLQRSTASSEIHRTLLLIQDWEKNSPPPHRRELNPIFPKSKIQI